MSSHISHYGCLVTCLLHVAFAVIVYIIKGGLGVVWAVLELNLTLLLQNEFYQRESQLQSEQKQLSEVVAMQQKQLSQKQGQTNIQAKG